MNNMSLIAKNKENLIKVALDVRNQSYSPYSNYKVGAALLVADGSIISGTNVENASYSVTICAERSAIVSAISAGKRDFVAIAVATSSKEPQAPCGVCRQSLLEFSDNLPIFCVNDAGLVVESALSDIYQMPFLKRMLIE